ncbi:cytochrome c biogenesis CcdA family protein [Mycobacterium sp. 050272]|uniref:cytochrome c biogenesis CcdA family protein n=1 Tax=Mycobacteriaceae TaxID=1762 RepID=UPI003192E265
MLDIGYLAAFLGGVLALLNPCNALLLPSFFAYAFSGPTMMVARTGVFYFGLAAVLVPLGAGTGGLAAILTEHRMLLIVAAGTVVIAFGLVQILGGGWTLAPVARFQARMAQRSTWVSTAGLGAAYGLAGFCSGPILGAVLTVAAAGAAPLRGAVLLAVYAAGMTAPLLILTAAWQRFDIGHRKWLRGREFQVGRLQLHTTSAIGGLLFVATGAAFVFFGGSTGIPTVDPRIALRAETAAAALAAHVPDTVVVLALLVVVVLTVRWRWRHARAGFGESAMPPEGRPAIVDGVDHSVRHTAIADVD